MLLESQAYSEPCQISKMDLFANIINGKSSTIFSKSFILDVFQGSENSSQIKPFPQRGISLYQIKLICYLATFQTPLRVQYHNFSCIKQLFCRNIILRNILNYIVKVFNIYVHHSNLYFTDVGSHISSWLNGNCSKHK